jgi:hypothetical protein
MKLLSYILPLVMFANTVTINAQAIKSSAYTYDDNGNRISASVIYLSTSLKSDTLRLEQITSGNEIFITDTTDLPENGWQPGIDDALGEMTIASFPNPAHGFVIVTISGGNDRVFNENGNYVKIWDIQGKLVYRNDKPGRIIKINLSLYPNGTYLVKISLDSRVQDYKIIKE